MAHKHSPLFLELKKNASPTTPAAGHIGLYFDNSDGHLRFINSSGLIFSPGASVITRDELALESDLTATTLEFPRAAVTDLGSNVTRLNIASNYRVRRSMYISANSGGVVSNVNCSTTLTAASATTATNTEGLYTTINTSAVIGNTASVFYTSTPRNTNTAGNPVFEAIIRTGAAITTERIWIGLFNGLPPNSDTLNVNGVGFRFNATGGWTPCAFDGTQTTGTTIGTVVLSTFYRLRIRIVSATNTAYFSVNDGTEQVISTNVYSGEVSLCAAVIATAAAARAILIGRLACECD